MDYFKFFQTKDHIPWFLKVDLSLGYLTNFQLFRQCQFNVLLFYLRSRDLKMNDEHLSLKKLKPALNQIKSLLPKVFI